MSHTSTLLSRRCYMLERSVGLLKVIYLTLMVHLGDGAKHLRKRNTESLPATSVQLNCVVVWLLATCPSTLVPKSPNSSFLFPLSTLNTQLSTPGVGRVLRLVTPDCHLLSSPLIPVAASHKVRHTLLSNKAFYLNFGRRGITQGFA